jgi:aryl-alcohol dehydrogenase-like predicted oxidoreductase
MESPKQQQNIHEITRDLETNQQNPNENCTQENISLEQQQRLNKLPLTPNANLVEQTNISCQSCQGPIRQGLSHRAQHSLIQNQFPNYGQNVQKQFLNVEQNQIDPTLELFNQSVPSQTHCLLGRTGVRVSRVTLGSMNFGQLDSKFGSRPGQLNEEEAHKILDRYLELGGNCIDTANFFPWFGSTAGQSEEIIGNWFAKLEPETREKIFLITKIRLPDVVDNINACGLSRFNIMNQINRCLKRLQTDYVDMLQINGWDYTVNVMDLVRTLDELVVDGKIRYYGVCDLKGWQTQKLIDYARIGNYNRCVCYAGEYNLLTRGVELEIAGICLCERIGFIGYSPFYYGLLNGEPTEGTRIESAKNQNPASMAEPLEEIQKDHDVSRLLDCCQRIGQQRNLTSAQVSLLWVLQQEFVTSAAIGVESIEELEQNMAVLNGNVSLTQQDLMELNDAAFFKYGYPYNCISSFAGYQTICPTLESSFEQMSLVYRPAEQVSRQEQLNQPIRTEDNQPNVFQPSETQEGEAEIVNKEKSSSTTTPSLIEPKHKSQIEETITQERTNEPQRN